MATLSVIHQALNSSNASVLLGSLTPLSKTYTLGSVFHVEALVVADNYGAAVLWQSGQGGVSTFEFGVLISSADLFVQLRNDDAGAAEYAIVKIPANLPFWFANKSGGNAAGDRLDAAVLVSGTDYDDIDQIKVQNDVADAAGDATVDLFLFK